MVVARFPSKIASPECGEPISTEKTESITGKVILVGAGPGDPDLLTVKALKAIQQADLILFDRLVSQEIRNLFPVSTPAIYVGKAKNHHSIPQEQLNQLLVEKASQGITVARIKGGDSFVFGRGGEEMLELRKAGIKVEVVPGITAGAGATSYAGIPLTHRGISQGCTFLTAHGEHDLNIDWKALVDCDHTLVFYMGLSKAKMIQDALIEAGMDPLMPVAVIEKGCCSDQRVFTGSLIRLHGLISENAVQSPAIIVVGRVVELSSSLQWFGEQVKTDTEDFINPEIASLFSKMSA